MANERIVSPGVFTRENDQTFLAQGVAAIGAGIVGPFTKGPAFVPVVLTSQNEALTRFGSDTYYTPYTVQNYLKYAGLVTVVRVLGQGGYSTYMYPIHNASGQILAILAPTAKNTSYQFTDFTITGSVTAAKIVAASSSFTASFSSAASNYITKVFGTDAKSTTLPLYVAKNFSVLQAIASGNVQTGSAVSTTFGGYDGGETPWVQSQTVGSSKHNLFKFETISDGDNSNTEIKVGIFDVKLASEVQGSDFGTFGVVVRKYTDTDQRPEVLETFTNITLDPNSVNYLPRVIGDRKATYRTIGSVSKLVYDGDWPNISKYVRVVMNTSLSELDNSVIPFGFGGYANPLNVNSFPTMSFVTQQVISGETNTRAYYGFDFSNNDSKQWIGPIPNTIAYSASAFSLEDYVGGGTGSLANRKFMLAFSKGFDGLDPRNKINQGADITAANSQNFNMTDANSSGTVDYKKALDIFSNVDEIDVNLIVTPGVIHSLHSSVTNYVINICETRGDCFYIMDGSQLRDGTTTAVNNVSSLDTNYAGTYYPWIKILDPNTSKPLWVPPSVVMPGVYAFNDQVGQEWYAPAGLTRGGLSEAIEPYTILTSDERGELYSGRVNPIARFPGQGPTAFGQKTLQSKASALDRINVRRLLIAIKKFIASTAKFLVFEQNVAATRQRFLNIVNPYLESVQQRSGIYAARVVMDESNNTGDVIDRNQMVAYLYIKPTRTAEYIIVDFNILPTGAEFPEGV